MITVGGVETDRVLDPWSHSNIHTNRKKTSLYAFGRPYEEKVENLQYWKNIT